MIYTAYSEEEYNNISTKYKKQVVGIVECGEILQIPLCPECGDEMMEVDGDYLSCMTCGAIRRKRVIKK